MIEPRADRPTTITLGADKAYDAEDFVNELRSMIAGEDDLDAPDTANEPSQRDKKAEVGLAPNSEPAPARSSQSRTMSPATPSVREKLSVEESAVLKAELIREIQTLPEDDLQSRAIAILKAKNRLSADDAKVVEEAFAARMAPRGGASESLTSEDPASAQTDVGQPPLAPAAIVKRPRGRPRKVKAPIDEAPVVVSAPMVDDSDVPDTKAAKNPSQRPMRDLDATRVVKIDKSMLYIPEVRRHRNKTHLRFVALQPCLICGRSPVDAHHLRYAQPRAMGKKNSDEFTVPLCRMHHSQNHRVGEEVEWWRANGIDPLPVARRLWSISRGVADKS
jgi:hypothetical protein